MLIGMATRTKLLDWFRRGGAAVYSALESVQKAFVNPDYRNRVKSKGERTISEMIGPYGIGGGFMPGQWTGNKLEQVQHYRHWVHRSISTIAMLATKEAPTIARVIPKHEAEQHKQRLKAWQQGKAAHPGERKFLTLGEKRGLLSGKSNQTVQAHEELEHLDDSNDLVRLIKNPNGPDTGLDFITETLMFLELTGEAYWWKVPYRGSPGLAEMWVMPSHWVWPQSTGKGKIIDHYEVRPFAQSGSAKPLIFDADEFIPFLYKSPLSKTSGHGTLQSGAEIVDTYESVQACRYFQQKNGANVGTAIQLSAEVDVDDNMLKRFEAKWLARFQGEHGFNHPAILPPGATLVQPPGDRELAMIQSSDQMRDYVIGMWGLTKSVLGFMEDANRASFEAALAQCFYLVVNPRLSMLGQVATEKLCPLFGEDLRLFWRDMTPADRATELQEWTLLLNKGTYKPNEYRQWMGLEPIAGGDKPVEPMQQVPGGEGGFEAYDEAGGADALERIRSAVNPESGSSKHWSNGKATEDADRVARLAMIEHLKDIRQTIAQPLPAPVTNLTVEAPEAPATKSIKVKVKRGEDGRMSELDVTEIPPE